MLTQYQIVAICENQTIEIDKSKYKIYPLVSAGDNRGSHSIRIKILKQGGGRNNTRDKSQTSSFPINLTTGCIRIDDIEYVKNIKTSEQKEQRDIAAGLGVFALEELIAVGTDANSANLTAFNNKVIEYSKLSKQNRNMYIDMGYGNI